MSKKNNCFQSESKLRAFMKALLIEYPNFYPDLYNYVFYNKKIPKQVKDTVTALMNLEGDMAKVLADVSFYKNKEEYDALRIELDRRHDYEMDLLEETQCKEAEELDKKIIRNDAEAADALKTFLLTNGILL